MFKSPFTKSPIEANLDAEIEALLKNMSEEMKKSSDEYATMTDQLTKLYELRHKGRVSKETLALIGANIAGIFVILSHERAHVIATKAFGLVKKIA
jgi:flagellar motor switch protein FliM